MNNKASLFVVLGVVIVCCSGWGQTGADAKTDEAFLAAVNNYAHENVADATIVRQFTQLSKQGDPRATLWLARLHWGGRCGLRWAPGIAYDMAEPVMEQVVKLAEGGDHEAQFLVGYSHHWGFVLKRSPAEAAKWFAKAIEGRQLLAYGNLAEILAEGEGVKADIAQARKLLKEGADLGSRYCRNTQALYAPPDSASMSRMRELRRNKVAQALGLKKEAAVRMLAEAGVITAPDTPIDSPCGTLSCLEFEDDGVILYSGSDGVVRCVDVSCVTTSKDDPRGVIPFGIVWRDGEEDVRAKLGVPFSHGRDEEVHAKLRSYQAGNMMFTVGFYIGDESMIIWRVRQMWQEDFPSEE